MVVVATAWTCDLAYLGQRSVRRLPSGESGGDSEPNLAEEFFSFTYLSLAAATRWRINVHVLFTAKLVSPQTEENICIKTLRGL